MRSTPDRAEDRPPEERHLPHRDVVGLDTLAHVVHHARHAARRSLACHFKVPAWLDG
jgi:hypothetical protein